MKFKTYHLNHWFPFFLFLANATLICNYWQILILYNYSYSNTCYSQFCSCEPEFLQLVEDFKSVRSLADHESETDIGSTAGPSANATDSDLSNESMFLGFSSF